MTDEIRHTHSPLLGGVLLETERNSRTVTLRVRVDRPRQEGESWADCAQAAVDLARETYRRAELAFPRPSETGS